MLWARYCIRRGQHGINLNCIVARDSLDLYLQCCQPADR